MYYYIGLLVIRSTLWAILALSPYREHWPTTVLRMFSKCWKGSFPITTSFVWIVPIPESIVALCLQLPCRPLWLTICGPPNWQINIWLCKDVPKCLISCRREELPIEKAETVYYHPCLSDHCIHRAQWRILLEELRGHSSLSSTVQSQGCISPVRLCSHDRCGFRL